MAKIKNFIYCLNATSDDKIANAMGILLTINPDYMPGNFSFSIFFTIVDIKEDLHNLKIEFLDPDGEEVIPALKGEIPYKKKEEDNELDSDYSGVNISANLQNVNLKKNGKYKTVITFDGAKLNEYEILVKGKKILKEDE